MTHKSRIAKLEQQADRRPPLEYLSPRIVDYRAGIIPGHDAAPDAIPLRMAKPSEILRRALELIADGATPTEEQRRRIEGLRQVIQ